MPSTKALVLPLAAAAAFFASVAASPLAHADRRAFTHTYEYMTMPKGDLELEFYNTQESYDYDTESATTFEQKVEVEYGITDHWDVSIYQVFGGGEEAGNQGFGYQETQVRTRYRFAERGEWPVDVLLYFEIIKPFGVLGLGVEPKLVLARDFGPLTAVLNLALEVEAEEEVTGTETEVEYEIEPEYALGVTYELVPEWKAGVESWGNLETFAETEEYAIYAGPAISWAPSSNFWATATAGFKLLGADDPAGENEPDFSFRIILGLHI
jgi:hypothetical protein